MTRLDRLDRVAGRGDRLEPPPPPTREEVARAMKEAEVEQVED